MTNSRFSREPTKHREDEVSDKLAFSFVSKKEEESMNQVFDVLSSIGAAAYCTPVGLDEIARMHPNRAEECKAFSAGITADLMRALSDRLIDPFTVRD